MSFWIAGIKLGNWMKAETIDFMDVTFGLFWNCRTRKIVGRIQGISTKFAYFNKKS